MKKLNLGGIGIWREGLGLSGSAHVIGQYNKYNTDVSCLRIQ